MILIVVDSLRRDYWEGCAAVESLPRTSWAFRRAYATECWTLPSHLSMFTGLMPSEHGAHFQSMAYRGNAPTIAEVLGAEGYHCEAITRNHVFDGTIPGVCRGFDRVQRPVSPRLPGLVELFLAAAKPRFRRHLTNTGFFHSQHRSNARFMRDFAAALLPADDRALRVALDTIGEQRAIGRPHFVFANLYDVHAPYPPHAESVLRPWSSIDGMIENLTMPVALAHLGEHRYLRQGFSLSDACRRRLRGRYADAVKISAKRLSEFLSELDCMGVFDDTLVILCSDHGEAFGEHGLYLHDASVYETHVRVPLWIWHPREAGGVVDDVVSLRYLFDLMRRAGCGLDVGQGTILDPAFRRRHAFAAAEHFNYQRLVGVKPEFRRKQLAIIGSRGKVAFRGVGAASFYDLELDRDELEGEKVSDNEGMDCLARCMPASAADAARVHVESFIAGCG